MKGLVAFSFALGKEEPNPCNVRLAKAVERIVDTEKEPVVVVVQWEIAKALNWPTVFVVEKHRRSGAYLDSEGVMAQAADIFQDYGITEVIPVANPFLHLTKCRALVRQHGFKSLKRKIGWIGFYKKSLQWYTRGPVRCFIYAVLQKFTGRRSR